ncbi:iron-siderophore ABC transporter substrate-binding protein [Streptomyces yunnanensis]|uniref:Iron-siderophore ABC transporter substrate-binding protein n=1 Tax=Streptomyces yunnanensis TaxID=156453 RepID=A0ABY8AGH3_9ACTN|nr:iron-siderophore ABC transporter substrate-binding protein [Streptomyces yunnanensis]WEB44068.1 iron-siderophore ABC transporter substrate-binding protein [Streptomyces yunnanensis]
MSRSFTRRAAAVAAVAALAVTATACGGGKDDARTEPKGGKHTVKTAMGDVEVYNHPKRVVVLDTDALDSAITLGVKPVGAVQAEAGAPLSTYLPKDKLAGIKKVGLIAEPNLEAIYGLKPDLILSSKARDEKSYQELSKIAPTVFTKTTGPAWRENFELHADALGKKDQVKNIVADYEKHVAKVTEALGGPEKAKSTKVGFVRFVEGADTRLYKNDTFVGSIFKDLKVGRPANVDGNGFSLDISPEKTDEANADVIFYSTYGDPEKAKETATTGGSMWKKLDAVKNKKVYAVNDSLWMLGIGYTGANKVLDEMEQKLR